MNCTMHLGHLLSIITLHTQQIQRTQLSWQLQIGDLFMLFLFFQAIFFPKHLSKFDQLIYISQKRELSLPYCQEFLHWFPQKGRLKCRLCKQYIEGTMSKKTRSWDPTTAETATLDPTHTISFYSGCCLTSSVWTSKGYFVVFVLLLSLTSTPFRHGEDLCQSSIKLLQLRAFPMIFSWELETPAGLKWGEDSYLILHSTPMPGYLPLPNRLRP